MLERLKTSPGGIKMRRRIWEGGVGKELDTNESGRFRPVGGNDTENATRFTQTQSDSSLEIIIIIIRKRRRRSGIQSRDIEMV